jgi:hypothetical protein
MPTTSRKRTSTTVAKRKSRAVGRRSRATQTTEGAQRSGIQSSRREIQQIEVLCVAILFGAFGFALHFLWFVSIVVMSVLLGMIAAEARGRRSVISEVVADVKNVADDIASGAEPSRS